MSNYLFNFSAFTNQDTLREIQRGYRLEKPQYPGTSSPEFTQQKLNGIYGVSQFKSNIKINF